MSKKKIYHILLKRHLEEEQIIGIYETSQKRALEIAKGTFGNGSDPESVEHYLKEHDLDHRWTKDEDYDGTRYSAQLYPLWAPSGSTEDTSYPTFEWAPEQPTGLIRKDFSEEEFNAELEDIINSGAPINKIRKELRKLFRNEKK